MKLSYFNECLKTPSFRSGGRNAHNKICWMVSINYIGYTGYIGECNAYFASDRPGWEAQAYVTDEHGRAIYRDTGGFSSRRAAAAWIIQESLLDGDLFRVKSRFLSPLELLAECAE